MKEEMEYLGVDVGYDRSTPAASKMQPLHDMQVCDDPKKGLHDVRTFWVPVPSISAKFTVLLTSLPLLLT